MVCEYCKSTNKAGDACEKCGAKLPQTDIDGFVKSEPFFYNGYICYTLRHPESDTWEVQFWLGAELIERIVVTRQMLDDKVQPYEDPMCFFWELFLVAHGEQEVMTWQEKNDKYPATFEVRRIENPERERWQALSLRELAMEARR